MVIFPWNKQIPKSKYILNLDAKSAKKNKIKKYINQILSAKAVLNITKLI
jgi:hypothetical protein